MNRADKQEYERRIKQISDMLLDGESTQDIIEFSRLSWNLKSAQTCLSGHSKKTRIETLIVKLIRTLFTGLSGHSKKTRIETLI